MLLPKLPNQCRPSPQKVLEQCLLLDECAEGQQDVEELVAVANDVIVARGETLRYGAREEDG